MTKIVKKINPALSTEENVLNDIRTLCLENPHNHLAVWIVKLIDNASIPIQMDKDLMRRLTDPVCNVHDINFEMPIASLTKHYA